MQCDIIKYITLFLTVATCMDANAQNNTNQVSQQPQINQITDPQQIKNYLNGAIQALALLA